MPYIRLSIARPLHGQDQRLEEIMRKLADAASKSEGCLQSYVLRPHDDSGEIARIAVYESEANASKAASDAHFMALRSELHLVAQPGHVERAFFSI